MLLHSVRKKEKVPFKSERPKISTSCYIVKNSSIPSLPNSPGGSSKNFHEEGLVEDILSQGEHVGNIQILI